MAHTLPSTFSQAGVLFTQHNSRLRNENNQRETKHTKARLYAPCCVWRKQIKGMPVEKAAEQLVDMAHNHSPVSQQVAKLCTNGLSRAFAAKGVYEDYPCYTECKGGVHDHAVVFRV